jgi:hypothetical protein
VGKLLSELVTWVVVKGFFGRCRKKKTYTVHFMRTMGSSVFMCSKVAQTTYSGLFTHGFIGQQGQTSEHVARLQRVAKRRPLSDRMLHIVMHES